MMVDLTEEGLLSLLAEVRKPMSIKPTQFAVSEAALLLMKALCADNPKFRKRVLAEFPQLEGIV